MRLFLGTFVLASAVAAAAVYWALERWNSGPAVAAPPPAAEMPGRALIGLQDDVSLRWAADRAEMLDRARDAGAGVIRTIVSWREAAPTRPVAPASGLDPTYSLDDLDDLARSAQARGVELLVTVWGTPGWANGGLAPNRAPDDPRDLRDFAHALADRYSGRHAGYPAVRLFSVWNEPNLSQFLAPQFEASGRSLSPVTYARLVRAMYDGVKEANPNALVAIGETSPRGHDRPGGPGFQDSHSPVRFARLLAAHAHVPFDAWATHPYPARPDVAPSAAVRWPRVGLGNLERFGEWLDVHFGREDVPIWITEYGHETEPDPLGVPLEVQARHLGEALTLVAQSPRVRMFVWFILRDTEGEPWESGLLAADGSPKPAYERYAELAPLLDARDPVVPEDVEAVRLPVLELAFHNPSGRALAVKVGGAPAVRVPLEPDGWIEVPIEEVDQQSVEVRARDPHGNAVVRTVESAVALN
jgi:polysaccharide biosynthesis protein PslG